MKRIHLIIVFSLIIVNITTAQTAIPMSSLLGDGIFLQGGVGYLALRDEYISNEKYSGSQSFVEAGWLKSNDSSAVRFSIIFHNAAEMKNNNLSSKVVQGGLNLDYIYPIGSFSLLTKNVYAFLGPSIEIFYYDRAEYVASGGFQSYATSYSLGINSIFILTTESKFSAECSAKLDLAGWGQRSVSSQKQTKFISIFSGINGSANFLLRYNISDDLIIKTGYRFEIFQSSSWDYILSASDNLIFAAAYRL